MPGSGDPADADDCADEDLAPAFVARAALFPLDRLYSLADTALAELAARACDRSQPDRHATGRQDYEAAYARGMRRQQQALAVATLDDAAFMKALAFGNDDLSRRVVAFGALPERRNKRVRQIEGTLYRHLARATWRTEPCDLWAGVAIGRFGPQTQNIPTPLRRAVAPDLGPYQALVQALAGHVAYVARGVYKLNPTLHADPEQDCWRFTVRVGSRVVHDQRPRGAALDALLQALAGMRPASLHDIGAELRGPGEPPDPSLDAMLAALVTAGLLIGGLAFPRRFASAWDALAQLPPLLMPEHARSWWSAVRRLRRLCRRLERQLPVMSLADLHAALDEAHRIPSDLATALGLAAPTLPRSVLRCDSGLPFVPVLDGADRARLRRAIRQYDGFERQHGVDLAARTAHRSLLMADTGADLLLPERLERWSQWLCSDAASVTAEADTTVRTLELPPIGALVVRPGRERLSIVGTTTEIGAAYGRYGLLHYGLAERARHRFEGHPLHAWYCRALAAAADRAGVQPVEYVGPCEGMPNALARPDFGVPTWDRWGTASSYREDQVVVTLTPSGDTAVPLLHLPGRERPAALFCFAPVNLGHSEPALERMLLSSFRELPVWLGPGQPLHGELGRDRPTPALRLPAGDEVRARRLFVHGDELAALAAANPAERFLWWQALARRHRWPAILLLARDGGRPLPVVRDSPLALEAVLQGLRNGVRSICIEEPHDPCCTVDTQGLAHRIEFILPHLRRRHAWSGLAAG